MTALRICVMLSHAETRGECLHRAAGMISCTACWVLRDTTEPKQAVVESIPQWVELFDRTARICQSKGRGS